MKGIDFLETIPTFTITEDAAITCSSTTKVHYFSENGINIDSLDIATLADGEMMSDNIVTALLRYFLYNWENVSSMQKYQSFNIVDVIFNIFRKQQCGFPIIDCLFYSILFGEQDTTSTSER